MNLVSDKKELEIALSNCFICKCVKKSHKRNKMRGSMIAFFSQRYYGKHFSAPNGGKYQRLCLRFTALSREAFLSTELWEASTELLAFHSAFVGSISQRHCGREASVYTGRDLFLR